MNVRKRAEELTFEIMSMMVGIDTVEKFIESLGKQKPLGDELRNLASNPFDGYATRLLEKCRIARRLMIYRCSKEFFGESEMEARRSAGNIYAGYKG